MSLAAKTKDIINHFGFKFNKGLGQNFLIDEEILENTIEAMDLGEGVSVIEIGPGIGTLTHEIAKRAGNVYSIEIDDTLIPILEETLEEYKNVHIINDDALKVDFKAIIKDNGLGRVKIAANLPYYVTTPVVTRLFTERLDIESITLMIQREAAERIMAEPGTKEYGYISVLVQYYSDISKIVKVPPSSFMPQPKVESVVVNMKIRPPRFEVKDERLFFKIVRDSFNMRRKTLHNALKPLGIPMDKIDEALLNSSIDGKRRGETLSIEEFARLANEIKRAL